MSDKEIATFEQLYDQETYIYGPPSVVEGTGEAPETLWYGDSVIPPMMRTPVWHIRVDEWGRVEHVPMPEVKINLLPGAQIPTKAHRNDAGYDLYLYEDIELPPGKVVFARTGIKISIPPGYEAQIRPRSGLANKQKIIIPNSPGTVDAIFRGEVLVGLLNLNLDQRFPCESSSGEHWDEWEDGETIVLQKGQRIAQMIFNKVETAKFLVVDQLEETERGEGGFGSTGK